jgi:hypothetical protein
MDKEDWLAGFLPYDEISIVNGGRFVPMKL